MSNLMSVPFPTLYFHSHLCCSCAHWHWHPSLTLLLVIRTVRHIFITTNGVHKAMSQYFYLYSLTRYQNETRHKCSSECVLYFYTSFFPIASLSVHTILPPLNKFFKPVSVTLFKLLLKPLSCSSLILSITCEINSFEMFLDSC